MALNRVTCQIECMSVGLNQKRIINLGDGYFMIRCHLLVKDCLWQVLKKLKLRLLAYVYEACTLVGNRTSQVGIQIYLIVDYLD